MLRRTITDALLIILVAAAILVFVGQITGQPVLLAYVETGSMEPAMDPGDGFIAVPAALTSQPSEGDVITYEAQEIQDGGLTTHRVIEVTDEGYETKGDANPFSDQDGDEPYVTDDQVVAKALQVNGNVVTIPYIGTIFSTIQEVLVRILAALTALLGFGQMITPRMVGIGLIALSLLLVISSFGNSDRSRERNRSRGRNAEEYDTRIVAILLLLLILLPANAAMVLPDDRTEFTIDGGEVADADGVSAGDDVTGQINAQNNGLIALLVISKPVDDDVELDRGHVTVPAGGSTTTKASVPAPPPDGERTVTVKEHRYLLLLPDSVLLSLHETSPFLALAVLNILIGAAVLGAVGGLLGFRTVQQRDTSRQSSLLLRIKRRIRA